MGGLKIQTKWKKTMEYTKQSFLLLNTVDIGPQSSKFRHLQVVHVAEDEENQKGKKAHLLVLIQSLGLPFHLWVWV